MPYAANIGKRIIELTSCHSTNDYALGLISTKEAAHGDVVYTENQLAGRGQRGSIWVSEINKNLTFSLILEPAFLSPIHQYELTVFASLAMVDYLESKGIKACIKWPNDIYVNKKKIGGILIENKIKGSTISYAIVGIGLNINQTNFPNLKATSMAEINGKNYNIYEELFHCFVFLNERYNQLKNGQGLRACYFNKLMGVNEQILFDDGEQFWSTLVEVDERGALVLNKNGVLKKYSIKEVKFLSI